jgi:hypothetical protein
MLWPNNTDFENVALLFGYSLSNEVRDRPESWSYPSNPANVSERHGSKTVRNEKVTTENNS